MKQLKKHLVIKVVGSMCVTLNDVSRVVLLQYQPQA